MGVMRDMQQKLHEVEGKLNEVKQPCFIEWAFTKVKEFGIAVMEGCSVM